MDRRGEPGYTLRKKQLENEKLKSRSKILRNVLRVLQMKVSGTMTLSNASRDF